MALSRRLRFEILRRDNYTCRYCGSTSPDVTLTVDHVVPTTLGGGDEPNNLVTACTECNSGKSSIAPDSPIVEDVDATAMLFAKAVERATVIRREQIDLVETISNEFDAAWLDRCPWSEQGNYSGRYDGEWESTIERLIMGGMRMDDFHRMIRIAFNGRNVANRDRWRYFCGVANKEMGRRQEMARQMLEDGQV